MVLVAKLKLSQANTCGGGSVRFGVFKKRVGAATRAPPTEAR